MTPVSQSGLTSTLVFILGAVGGWLVTKGVLTTDQVNALTPELVALIPTVAAIAVGWWKARQHTPTALVATVNSPAVPGVKVVAESSASPQVVVTPTGEVKVDKPLGASMNPPGAHS